MSAIGVYIGGYKIASTRSARVTENSLVTVTSKGATNPSTPQHDMAPQTILITGCSSGIGLDAARTLQEKGWRVFAACRQQTDVDRLRQEEGLETLLIDYTKPAGPYSHDAAAVQHAASIITAPV